MTYSLFLFSISESGNTPVPEYWRKFYAHHRAGQSISQADEKLLEEGGRFRIDRHPTKLTWGDRWIDFENEQQAVMFVLRWS